MVRVEEVLADLRRQEMDIVKRQFAEQHMRQMGDLFGFSGVAREADRLTVEDIFRAKRDMDQRQAKVVVTEWNVSDPVKELT